MYLLRKWVDLIKYHGWSGKFPSRVRKRVFQISRVVDVPVALTVEILGQRLEQTRWNSMTSWNCYFFRNYNSQIFIQLDPRFRNNQELFGSLVRSDDYTWPLNLHCHKLEINHWWSQARRLVPYVENTTKANSEEISKPCELVKDKITEYSVRPNG